MNGQTGHISWKGAAFIAAAAMFVVAQLLAAAHGAKYGDAPHEHGGQPCVIALAAPGGEKAVSTTALVLVVSLLGWLVVLSAPASPRAPARVRAARPRGPPSR